MSSNEKRGYQTAQAWLKAQNPNTGLMCRDSGIRHAWTPYTVKKVGKIYEETLACYRCGSQKVRHLKGDGTIIKTNYSYPEGFERKGLGRISKKENAAIRLYSLKSRTKE